MTPEVDEVYPCKPGDWLVSKSNAQRVAKVKAVYADSLDRGRVVVDLYLYSVRGDRIPRASPVEGGPRTFEPACDYDNWHRIEEPAWPISLVWKTDGEGRRVADWSGNERPLPDIRWSPRKRRPRQARMPRVVANLDAELEARARRMAAEILRDKARDLTIPVLKEEAEKLEREAERILER